MGNWLSNERGATAIEYALIATGVATAIALLVFTIGGKVVDHLYTPVVEAQNHP